MLILGSLLPAEWFDGSASWLLMVVTLVCMLFVIKGADWLVEGAAGIAKKFGMPEVIIGATIVSLGTTTPEAAVSVLAAWNGNSGLALGNGVGSIIADTGLIFGIGCLMTRLPADRFVLSRQGWVQFGSGALLTVVCFVAYMVSGGEIDGARLGRGIGLLFVALLVVYLMVSVKWSKAHPHGEPRLVGHEAADVKATGFREGEEAGERERGVLALLLMGFAGLVMVVLSGDGLVGSVSELAVRFGVPEVVVASTLVAFGTSLPELIVGITAIRKGHAELLVGNIIGADILNVLFVIGVSACATPLVIGDAGAKLPWIFLQLHLPMMMLMLLLMRGYIFATKKTGRFERWMGVPMVVLYVVFVGLQYALS
ncbi:sodium:calcium antiporter [Poriferisphaera sp. WC338]|uniref:sodium:calcium antiporter n=1 Tax=Poriferisphaera sp. WC338 TaxID=3425129 RepID=UPI003D81A082